MPWFPQMWAAGVLLNGRLLRENALQGAEQLGGETVRALNGGFVPSRDWQALAPGVCVWGRGQWRGQGESPPGKLHSLSCPLLCLVLSPSAIPPPGWPGGSEHRLWGLIPGPHLCY